MKAGSLPELRGMAHKLKLPATRRNVPELYALRDEVLRVCGSAVRRPRHSTRHHARAAPFELTISRA